MPKEITEIKQFFNEDQTHPITSQELIKLFDLGLNLPSHIFINLETKGVTPLYRENLIELLKHKLTQTVNEADLLRLLNQLQFTLTDIKTK